MRLLQKLPFRFVYTPKKIFLITPRKHFCISTTLVIAIFVVVNIFNLFWLFTYMENPILGVLMLFSQSTFISTLLVEDLGLKSKHETYFGLTDAVIKDIEHCKVKSVSISRWPLIVHLLNYIEKTDTKKYIIEHVHPEVLKYIFKYTDKKLQVELILT